MTVSDIKKYLKTAVELEQRRYILKNTISEMDRIIATLANGNRPRKPQKASLSESLKDMFEENTMVLLMIPGWILFAVLSFWGSEKISKDKWFDCLEMPLSVLGYLFIIASVLVFVMFVVPTVAEYIKESKNYPEEIKEYSNKIKYYERQLTLERAQRDRMLEQREMAFEQLTNTTDVLLKLYEVGVIYPKYCNFVAICSFYDYFASGRCSTLQGHEGAYNLFESELRLNLIVSKLDDVISKLDAIENNQYMLHNAISEGNRSVNRLVSNVTNLTETMSYCAGQTELAAQNAAWAAHELNTIKWLNVIK